MPNVSEGRDRALVLELADAVEAAGARVADVHSDADHNRSVLSVWGDPLALIDGLVGLAEACVELIDLRYHEGVHPRVGALDVAPIVALEPGDMALARETAVALAERLGVLDLPVFLYGAASPGPEAVRPADLRRAGYDTLDQRVREGELTPDFGPRAMHPTAGAVLVGARPPLIAWNVELADGGVAEARALADLLRESGGGLPGLRALGLYLPDAGVVQVSMNIEDLRATPPRTVMKRLRREAERLGVRLGRSELVGLIPREALIGTSTGALGLAGFTPAQLLEARIPALRQSRV